MSGADLLILSPHLAPPPGGVQRLAMNIADAIHGRRVRLVGVSEKHSDDPRARVVRQRPGRVGALRTSVEYTLVAAGETRHGVGLVQAMTWRAALGAFMVPRRPPVVLFCHGAELVRSSGGPLNAALRRFVLRRVEAIVANSQYTADLVRTLCGREATVVHPPVSIRPADVAPRGVHEALRVLAVGRLVRNKGHDRLVRAVGAARRAGVDLTLTIVGTGPERGALAHLIASLGLGDVVNLAGAVSDDELDRLYRRADVFALLSIPVAGEVEGFGIVFLEANAYKLPVIAGRSGGSQEAVADGISGLLVDDHDQAVAALMRLASDPVLRRELGEAGFSRLEQFSIDRFGEQLRAVYARL